MRIRRAPTGLALCIALFLTLPTLSAHAHEHARWSGAQVSQALNNRLILADYMMWYQPDVFDGAKTFDVPAAGPYNSDDMGTIQRHLQLAQQACLNGFTAHWFGAKEPRTTDNFNKLLAASSGSHMQHAVVLLENSLKRAKESDLIDSVNFVMANWASHPNYLKIDGKPVIFFEGMTRPWGSVGAAWPAAPQMQSNQIKLDDVVTYLTRPPVDFAADQARPSLSQSQALSELAQQLVPVAGEMLALFEAARWPAAWADMQAVLHARSAARSRQFAKWWQDRQNG